jgi:hypothetical protein
MVVAFNCAPCSGSDPTQDTVKVDPSLLSQENKENSPQSGNVLQRQNAPAEKCAGAEACAPSAAQRLADEREAGRAAERQAAEQAAREEAERLEAERQRMEAAEDARRRQEEQQRLEAERQRLQTEADTRQKQEADASAAAQESERLRQEKEAAEAAQRIREEVEQQAMLAAQKQAAIEKAQAFLSANRFANVNDLRKSTFKAKRPLHSAVKINDVETVRGLLLAGADPSLTNSAGKTPKQLAEELDKKGYKKGCRSGALEALAMPVCEDSS